MNSDNEINALNDVYETLKGLDHAQIKRIERGFVNHV